MRTSELGAERSEARVTAFAGSRCLATGGLACVVAKVKEAIEQGEPAPCLIFDEVTSEQVEVDLRGSMQDVLSRIERSADLAESTRSQTAAGATAGPGRPKLGVISREVTLLPRHWEWLNRQPNGASAALRRLVEAAKRANAGQDRARAARDATYRFMVALGGDLSGFEEATRVLFAKRPNRLREFERRIGSWPEDVRKHLSRLMRETLKLEKLAGASESSSATIS